jgi:hypothetical protein
MHNTDLVYKQQNQLKEAEALILKTLSASQRVLGADNPRTLITMNTLIHFYHQQNRLQEV